jgi:hypothetical protein
MLPFMPVTDLYLNSDVLASSSGSLDLCSRCVLVLVFVL